MNYLRPWQHDMNLCAPLPVKKRQPIRCLKGCYWHVKYTQHTKPINMFYYHSLHVYETTKQNKDDLGLLLPAMNLYAPLSVKKRQPIRSLKGTFQGCYWHMK